MNNEYYHVYQLSYPEDFNFENTNPNPPVQMPISLQSQPCIQNFLPSVTSFPLFDNVDAMSLNATDYEDTRTYPGDDASYQGLSEYAYLDTVDTTNEQLNTSSRNQVETHTNSLCPLSAPFQTPCGPSVLHSDMTTDNSFHRSDVPNNTCISYMLIRMPASNEYVVMREERTQSMVGRISAASSIGEMLALTRM